MRREILESMSSNGFGEFITACEDLKNSRYIIAESKIPPLLKAIADNRQLYLMFGSALNGFDYKKTFSSCVTSGGFSLPTDRNVAIALVFRLLMDFDRGNISLGKFLEKYFHSDSVNESFARFGLEIIAPFESYCKDIFEKVENGEEQTDDSVAYAYDDANEKFYVSLKRNAISDVNALIDIGDESLTNDIDRIEFCACLRGLIRAISRDADDDMASAFIGVKYAVSYFFKNRSDTSVILKKIEYAVKHLVNR